MHVVSQNSSNITASESTDDDSEFNQIRVRQIVKKIIYGVKFIWISIGNLDPTIIFVILEWLLDRVFTIWTFLEIWVWFLDPKKIF